MMGHMWKFLVWLDYFANQKVLLGGRWETISSRCYRNHKKYWYCRWLMRGLDSIQKDHCRDAYLKDILKNPTIPLVDWDLG